MAHGFVARCINAKSIIWETIRAYPGVDLSWADRSDEEVRAEVTRRVDDRLAAAAAGPGAEALARLTGVIAFGELEAPHEDQIAHGIASVAELRRHQREILAAIDELRRLNRPPPPVPHAPDAPDELAALPPPDRSGSGAPVDGAPGAEPVDGQRGDA